MSLNHLSLSQYDIKPESDPLFIKATKYFEMGVMKQYFLKKLYWSQWFTKFVTIFHNPCHVTPWAASILLSVQKILLLLSSRVYLESMSGPSSGRNDVLLCPQIVHNWRTENAYLPKNIHTHWRWRSWCWCEYKWQRSSARANCPSLTTTTTTPNLLTQASLNVLLSLRLSFFQVLCFSHQRSTSLRPGRLTAISSRSRTGSGGRWSPWPPSATGTWRRTLISMLEPWPLFFLGHVSGNTHTQSHKHTIFLWHCITFSSAFLANNRNAWQLCSTNQTKPNCFQ